MRRFCFVAVSRECTECYIKNSRDARFFEIFGVFQRVEWVRYPSRYPRNRAFAGWLPAHGYQAGYQRKRTFLDGLTALVDGPVDGETALFGEHVTAAVTPAVTAKAYFAGRCARMRCAVWCALKAACEPVKTLHIERYALGWYASWYARNRGRWRRLALAG